MFIGRHDELIDLEKLYKSEKFEMAIIYGRRRVGKSTLIQEFIKNKKCINFTSIETSRKY
jgi:AAA+ ATPase superfamily predicted ATPase